MAEPTAKARVKAFEILRRHPECLRDDTVMDDLIDEIARAIDIASAINDGD